MRVQTFQLGLQILHKMKNWVYYMQEGLKSMWPKKEKKKTKHKGDESTVGFWLYMKALYKEK